MRADKTELDEQETILIFNLKDCYWEGKTNIPHHMTAFENAGWETIYDYGHERVYRSPTTASQPDNFNTK